MGTFNLPNAEGGKGDNQGAIKGDSFCRAVDVVGVGVSSGRDPSAHLSSLRLLQLGQLGTLKSAMAGLSTMENGKSYK